MRDYNKDYKITPNNVIDNIKNKFTKIQKNQRIDGGSKLEIYFECKVSKFGSIQDIETNSDFYISLYEGLPAHSILN